MLTNQERAVRSQQQAGSIVTITPTEARRMLEKNRNIRQVRPMVVAQYTREMLAGRWRLNGETIKLDADGWLVDGQHRLLACIESDRPFTTWLITNATGDGVDEGRSRSFHDLMGGRGIVGKTIAGALVRTIYFLSSGGDPWQRSDKIGNQTLMEFYEGMPPARFERALRIGIANQKPIPGTAVAAIAYQVGETEAGFELVEEFFSGMSKLVGLPEGGAQIRLLKWAEGARANNKGQGSLGRRAMYVASGRAWNAYVQGRMVTGMSLWSRIHDSPLPKLITR